MENNSFMIFSGTKSKYLAKKICANLNCPLGNLVITHFADGEFSVSYEESIRGREVFLIQSTFPNADNLMELRKYHSLSQEELAEKIGVSRQTLSKYETGGSLS